MKGFVYVTTDGDLIYKSYEYIKTENPSFWVDNSGYYERYWEFDTENESSMRAMLLQLASMRLENVKVVNFLSLIHFDLSKAKSSKNDNQARSNKEVRHIPG